MRIKRLIRTPTVTCFHISPDIEPLKYSATKISTANQKITKKKKQQLTLNYTLHHEHNKSLNVSLRSHHLAIVIFIQKKHVRNKSVTGRHWLWDERFVRFFGITPIFCLGRIPGQSSRCPVFYRRPWVDSRSKKFCQTTELDDDSHKTGRLSTCVGRTANADALMCVYVVCGRDRKVHACEGFDGKVGFGKGVWESRDVQWCSGAGAGRNSILALFF